jgi:hypothetical protein
VLDVPAFAFAGMITVNAFSIVNEAEGGGGRYSTAAFYF